MRIIAIDPGNTESAWCVLRDGKPVAFGKESNSEMLIQLRREWSPSVDLLAVEMIQSFGMPVGREVFETVLWIGRYLEAWESRRGRYDLVYRKDVKLFHCESTRATDANIRASIIDRFDGKKKAIGRKASPGPLYGLTGDAWSALAVGLTSAARVSLINTEAEEHGKGPELATVPSPDPEINVVDV